MPSLVILFFSRFGFIVRTESQTEEDDCYTHATTIGVSNYSKSRRKAVSLRSVGLTIIMMSLSLSFQVGYLYDFFTPVTKVTARSQLYGPLDVVV